MIIHSYPKFLLKSAGYLIHKLSAYVPRRKDKWVFGTCSKYYDNPKYLYLEVCGSHPEIDAIWIGKRRRDVRFLRERGLKAAHWLSPVGIWHCLTAGVWISHNSVRDINPYLSGGAFYVNLWHGVGVKVLRWLMPQFWADYSGIPTMEGMKKSLAFKIDSFYLLFRRPDLCLVPSRFQAETFFAPMLDIPLERCLLGGYPRNELMLREKGEVMDFIARYEPPRTAELVRELEAYERVYIYMPTWRNDGEDFMSVSRMDWERLDRVLEKTNSAFLLKLHPYTRLEMESLSRYPRVIPFPPECDVYAVFPFTDCLITDYSSVYSDYTLMDKEIILFPFDYDSYVQGSYELKDYDRYYPGTRAYDFEQLLRLIGDKADCHVSREERGFIMETYWGDAFNGVDIVGEIKERTGRGSGRARTQVGR